jgi:hypothetical protein
MQCGRETHLIFCTRYAETVVECSEPYGIVVLVGMRRSSSKATGILVVCELSAIRGTCPIESDTKLTTLVSRVKTDGTKEKLHIVVEDLPPYPASHLCLE